MFAIQGNICGERVKIARILQNPSMSQEELVKKLETLGLKNFDKQAISRVERNQRHVIDAELCAIAQVLNVSMDWLVGKADVQDIFKR